MLPVSCGIRPLRDYSRVSAWRDGAEANLYSEVFRRFIKEWLQTDVDRRRIKGVEISSLFPLSSADTSVVKRFAQANVLKSLILEGKCLRRRAKPAHTWEGIYQLRKDREGLRAFSGYCLRLLVQCYPGCDEENAGDLYRCRDLAQDNDPDYGSGCWQ